MAFGPHRKGIILRERQPPPGGGSKGVEDLLLLRSRGWKKPGTNIKQTPTSTAMPSTYISSLSPTRFANGKGKAWPTNIP